MVIENYQNLVNVLSYEFSRRYRMVAVDDIRQQMWLWFFEHPNKVKQWEALDSKECTKLVARSLRNCAKDYCQKEKATKLGYRIEDLYYYDRELVELILPPILTGDTSAPSFVDLGFTKARKVLSEGGNWLTMCSDVERALNKLTVEQQYILDLRFKEGQDAIWISHEMKISVDAVRMRINRGIKSLINILGGDKPRHDRDYREQKNDNIDSNAGDGQEYPENIGDFER